MDQLELISLYRVLNSAFSYLIEKDTKNDCE